MDTLTVYIIDTSSLVTLHRWRPPGKNRKVWQDLDGLIRDDMLVAPDEVYDEIQAGQDALSRWAKRRKQQNQLFKRPTRRSAGPSR